MKNFIDSFKKTGRLHHAYAIEGDREIVLQKLFIFFEKEAKIQTRGNPDFWQGNFESFGIDDARVLVEAQLRKAVSGDRKIFVILVSSMTREAQNSLLKIFEEPTEGTHFFLVLPNADVLLDTLKSRLVVESVVDNNFNKEKIAEAEKFVRSGIAKRLELIEEIVKEKGKSAAAEILNGVEIVLKSKIGPDQKEFLFFEELWLIKKFLNYKGASVKLILEHLALACPSV